MNSKRSQSLTGSRNPFFGKSHTTDARELMSAIRKSEVPNKLKKFGITTEEYFAKVNAGFKWCGEHKNWLPLSEFHKSQGVCKACGAKRFRRHMLAKSYGVTPEWYDAILAEQNGGCAICGSTVCTVKSGTRKFHVDHKRNGKTRGLLCHLCNHALERLETCPDWAAKAAIYLLKYAN